MTNDDERYAVAATAMYEKLGIEPGIDLTTRLRLMLTGLLGSRFLASYIARNVESASVRDARVALRAADVAFARHV